MEEIYTTDTQYTLNTRDQINLEQVMSKLKKLFEYYCQYGEKLNTNILKSHKFIKLADDCKISDSEILNKTRLEIIYKVEAKNKTLDFKSFLNSLIRLAKYKYQNDETVYVNSELSKTKALNKLIQIYLLPKYDEIYNSTYNETKKDSYYGSGKKLNLTVPNIEQIIFEKNIQEILVKVSPILFEVYKAYFPFEISLSEDLNYVKDQSFKTYFIFLKNFDLYPSLVSKPLAFQIYQSEEEESPLVSDRSEDYLRLIQNVDLKNLMKFYAKSGNILGQHFNFFRFIRVVLKIGEVGYENLEKTNINLNFNKTLPGKNANRITRNISLDKSNTDNCRNCFNQNLASSSEKLLLTLERMELSEGFINLQKKTSKTHSSRNSIILSADLMQTLNTNFYSSTGQTAQTRQTAQGINDRSISRSEIEEPSGNSVIVHRNTEERAKFPFSTSEDKESSYLQDQPSTAVQFLNDQEAINYISQTYGEKLVLIFKSYTSYGDPLNTKYMKSKIFAKLLREANLVSTHFVKNNYNIGRGSNFYTETNEQNKKHFSYGNPPVLNMNDVDSLFMKLCYTNKAKSFSKSNLKKSKTSNLIRHSYSFSLNGFGNLSSIDFNTFILSIIYISRKLFPQESLKHSVDYIIKEHILKYLSSCGDKIRELENKFYDLREKQNDNEFVYVLGLVYGAFFSVYNFYANKNGTMNFSQLLRFATDFHIFPDYVSKSRLNSFFEGIIIYKSEIQEKSKDGNSTNLTITTTDNHLFIEYSHFIDILTLCGFDIVFADPEPSPVEKVNFYYHNSDLINCMFFRCYFSSKESHIREVPK